MAERNQRVVEYEVVQRYGDPPSRPVGIRNGHCLAFRHHKTAEQLSVVTRLKTDLLRQPDVHDVHASGQVDRLQALYQRSAHHGDLTAQLFYHGVGLNEPRAHRQRRLHRVHP